MLHLPAKSCLRTPFGLQMCPKCSNMGSEARHVTTWAPFCSPLGPLGLQKCPNGGQKVPKGAPKEAKGTSKGGQGAPKAHHWGPFGFNWYSLGLHFEGSWTWDPSFLPKVGFDR